MSAITGIGDCTTIALSASTSWSRGAATRTMSAPASATLWIWSIVADRLAVSVFVIDCTETGAPPPTGTPPTMICREWRRGASWGAGTEGRPKLIAVTLSLSPENCDRVDDIRGDGQ